MATSGIAPDAALPLRDALRNALRRPGHCLEDGREDGAEGHVIGRDGERAVKFGFIMGADAEPQAMAADGGEIGRLQILLAEMDEVARRVDRDANNH